MPNSSYRNIKKSQTIDLNNNIQDIFTGFCKQENHINKLEFFCKNHNELVCVACISKLKNKFYGQHTDCEICNIEEIQKEKKNNLNKNIICLEDLSKSLEKSIAELKNLFEKINENRDNIKVRIQRVFTAIRNSLNDREDELLSEVDKSLKDMFFDEDYVKKGDKLPNKIKMSLKKGKEINQDWDKDLTLSINNSIEIENALKDINDLNENIENYREMKNVEVKFSPTNEYRLYYILEVIKNFGQIFKNNYKYSFIKITEIDLEIPKNGVNLNNKSSKIMQDAPNQGNIPPPQIFWQNQFSINDFPIMNQGLNINDYIDNLPIESPQINEVMEENIKEEILYNKPFGDESPFIGINLDDSRIYTITGEKENIITKNGKDNTWMGSICQIEFDKSKEYSWTIKILKTQNNTIMVGIAPIDFDLNLSIYNYGWYLNCNDSKLYLGSPHNYNGKETNLNKIKDKVKIVMNMNEKTLKFIIDNEDKGISYKDIPVNKPLSPVVLLYNTNDSVEISEN